MTKRLAALFSFGFLLLTFSVANADTIPIDLNDFYADTSVTVAADGSSATMNEDPSLGTVLLSNDPYYGDPGIAVPSGLLSLNFHYLFTEGPQNDDEFYAKVFNGDTGDILDDLLIVGNGIQFGTVSWDLSGIDPTITLLGLEFQLNAWDFLSDSFAEVANVSLSTASAPVPEPATLLLIGSGLVGLFGIRRKEFLKKT